MSRRPGALSRAKGVAAERELAGELLEWLGVRLVRNLDQSRAGGHDLVVAPDQPGPAAAVMRRYALEVKRRARVTRADLLAWWSQAEAQAQAAALVPVLAYRADRSPWRIIVPLAEVRPGLTLAPGLDYTADLSVPAFCSLIREAPED